MKRKGFAVIALGAIVAMPGGTLWGVGVVPAVIGTIIVFADEAVS